MRNLKLTVAAAAFALALPALAQQRAPAEPVLGLQDVLALAKSDQPRIEAYEHEAQASEQAAVAARSLPDPQLTVGIQNFPITGSNAFSLTDDFMTMYTIGVMREQVRRSKRDAESNRILAEAQLSRRQASAEDRQIYRQVMIAWIDAVEARAKQKLLQRLIEDLRAGRKVIEAGVPTGSLAPSLALEADAEIGLEESQLADARRAENNARAKLARWIGEPAYSRPLPDALPKIEVSTTDMPAIEAHPEVQVALAEQQAAQKAVTVAREDRKPDISWSVSVGFRPKFDNMITGTLSIPLQINRGNRQDRLVSAAETRADAARLRVEDTRRQLAAMYREAVADYEGADAALARIERDAVPALEGAFKVSEARYAAGAGTLERPFDIVRKYVEVTIQSVEARGRRARAAAEIIYVHGEMRR